MRVENSREFSDWLENNGLILLDFKESDGAADSDAKKFLALFAQLCEEVKSRGMDENMVNDLAFIVEDYVFGIYS